MIPNKCPKCGCVRWMGEETCRKCLFVFQITLEELLEEHEQFIANEEYCVLYEEATCASEVPFDQLGKDTLLHPSWYEMRDALKRRIDEYWSSYREQSLKYANALCETEHAAYLKETKSDEEEFPF